MPSTCFGGRKEMVRMEKGWRLKLKCTVVTTVPWGLQTMGLRMEAWAKECGCF